MSNLTKKLINKLTTVLLISTVAFSAWAISLDDAKDQGLVGEMQNGYLGMVVDTAETKALVETVNKKRKSIYIDIARKNKITMQQVTALAGEKALVNTQSGHFIQNTAGEWIKK